MVAVWRFGMLSLVQKLRKILKNRAQTNAHASPTRTRAPSIFEHPRTRVTHAYASMLARDLTNGLLLVKNFYKNNHVVSIVSKPTKNPFVQKLWLSQVTKPNKIYNRSI